MSGEAIVRFMPLGGISGEDAPSVILVDGWSKPIQLPMNDGSVRKFHLVERLQENGDGERSHSQLLLH